MRILKLAESDFKIINGKKTYIGSEDLSNFNGHLEIDENLGNVFFEKDLSVSGYILAKAGSGIEAGLGIEAGEGIKAGEGIEAGWGIEAGSGIEAGLSIFCKKSLSCKLRIFAGTCIYKIPTFEETQIICGKLEKGQIAYGILVETGIEEQKKDCISGKKVLIDGKEYILNEVK